MAGKRTSARMARLVARWRKSGESRSSFAPRHHVPAWTFWYWCRKLSDNPPSESSEAPPATFAPVRVAADTDAIRLLQVGVHGNDAKERNCPLWSERPQSCVGWSEPRLTTNPSFATPAGRH